MRCITQLRSNSAKPSEILAKMSRPRSRSSRSSACARAVPAAVQVRSATSRASRISWSVHERGVGASTRRQAARRPADINGTTSMAPTRGWNGDCSVRGSLAASWMHATAPCCSVAIRAGPRRSGCAFGAARSCGHTPGAASAPLRGSASAYSTRAAPSFVPSSALAVAITSPASSSGARASDSVSRNAARRSPSTRAVVSIAVQNRPPTLPSASCSGAYEKVNQVRSG